MLCVTVQVMRLSSLNNEGIAELWKVIEEYRDKMLVRE